MAASFHDFPQAKGRTVFEHSTEQCSLAGSMFDNTVGREIVTLFPI